MPNNLLLQEFDLNVFSIPIVEEYYCKSVDFNPEGSLSEKTLNHFSRLCPPKLKYLVENRLHGIISSISFRAINTKFVSRLMKENFDTSLFVSHDERKILFEMEIALKSAVIYYLSLHPENIFDQFNIIEELLQEYPSFRNEGLDIEELQYLLIYRNMMTIALTVIPAKGNKNLLMKACAFLEGSGRGYPTGGTQSRATCRRVLIYEQESQCPRRKRPANNNGAVLDAPIIRPPVFVECQCGATILKRTMWKHQKSLKHRAFETAKAT